MANIMKSLYGRILGLTNIGTVEAPYGYATTPQVITSTDTTINPYGTTIIATTALLTTHVLGTPSANNVGVFKNIILQIPGTSTASVVATESTAVLFTAATISTGLTLTTTSTATGHPSIELQYASTGKWQVTGRSTAIIVA